ncbi:unnamed protein product [Medioppia subpectinata]|uniref:Fatty acyl-CoA reductase n=1 Tax=Medioppia subpectinata TaxID=1979941 RepID=A0A7R9KTF1_9ACAR|nr:unnamed protein product [Medioppia subpectinata]CAG2109494.1 unnamed protein product [Medioppia subpectinata]
MDSPIRDYYNGKSILITGGTGFIGKVLCEKLLRSCPGVDNIFVLLRPRNDKTAQQRLQEDILDSKVFTLNNNGLNHSKIVAVSGDVSTAGLGLSDEDRDRLISEVSVVFHSAASVKFHGPLNDFIVQNVCGTQAVMQLCSKMTKLEVCFVISYLRWVDNVNGVAGALMLGALGIARTMEVNCDAKADLIPVDMIANSLVVIGWHSGTHPNDKKQVIHLTSGVENPVTWGKFLDYSRVAAVKAPSIRMVRPLAKNPTSYRGPLGRINHVITKYVSHILFAYFVDAIITLLGYKRIMVKVTNKMHRAFTVLEHFTNKEWVFHNTNYYEIHDKLSEEDQKLYFSDIRRLIIVVKHQTSLNKHSTLLIVA